MKHGRYCCTSARGTTLNSHKFVFALSPKKYVYWKAMIEPFLISNNLFGYVDGTIPCPPKTVTFKEQQTINLAVHI